LCDRLDDDSIDGTVLLGRSIFHTKDNTGINNEITHIGSINDNAVIKYERTEEEYISEEARGSIGNEYLKTDTNNTQTIICNNEINHEIKEESIEEENKDIKMNINEKYAQPNNRMPSEISINHTANNTNMIHIKQENIKGESLEDRVKTLANTAMSILIKVEKEAFENNIKDEMQSRELVTLLKTDECVEGERLSRYNDCSAHCKNCLTQPKDHIRSNSKKKRNRSRSQHLKTDKSPAAQSNSQDTPMQSNDNEQKETEYKVQKELDFPPVLKSMLLRHTNNLPTQHSDTNKPGRKSYVKYSNKDKIDFFDLANKIGYKKAASNMKISWSTAKAWVKKDEFLKQFKNSYVRVLECNFSM